MFQTGGILATIVNVLLALVLRHRLRAAFPRRPGLVDGLVLAGFVLLAHPALSLAVASWSGMRALQRYLPEWFSMIAMGAQVGLVFYGLLLGPWTLGVAVISILRRRKALSRIQSEIDVPVAAPREAAAQPAPEPAPAPVSSPQPVDEGRRRVVTAAAWALPAAAFALSMGGVAASRQRPTVIRLALPVRRDLTNLHGLTIAQVSDVHVGNFMDAERLDEIRDAINALRADFHVVTGDLLDNHVSQLELSTRFLRGLQPVRGQVFFAMGNHEYIAARSADVATLVKGIEDAGAHVLVDEAREIRVGPDRLWMGAIDYPPRTARPGEQRRRPTKEGLARALGQMRDDGGPRILLSHHPRAFAEARDLPFDLMLSGHTHGGQISLGRIGDHALTPMLPIEPLHNGLYQHDGRRLHVNAGAGGWLPVRINCPPEITLVELVPA